MRTLNLSYETIHLAVGLCQGDVLEKKDNFLLEEIQDWIDSGAEPAD